jgi:hypothetical protein
MPDKDPATMFDATGGAAAEAHADDDPAGADRAADATETVADRRARAARIRERSLELIEALGADHPWWPRPSPAPMPSTRSPPGARKRRCTRPEG